MKVKFSGIGITEGSGKLGGSVITRGRSGQAVRVRVKPINPQTNLQTSQRSKLSTRSQAWRGLTEEQRAGWNAAANSGQWPLKNTLGTTFQPTGAQLFNQLNLNLQKIGASTISAVPIKESFPLAGIAEFEIGNDVDSLTFTFVSTGTFSPGYMMCLYASPPLSVGTSRPQKLQFLAAIEDDDTPEPGPLYRTLFGMPAAGTKVFVLAKLVSATTGQETLVGQVSTIVYQV